jgi:diguanylate cyclase (GGDEF)-like protein
MKVGKSEGPGAARRVTAAYAKAPQGPGETVALAPLEPVRASLFGIPEAEFTPRVRTAIMALLQEVERMRRDAEQARAQLKDAARSADQDMLLPILNRRAFVRELSRFIAFAERYGTSSSLIYFDLDDFKRVNDAHGHPAGDFVLNHFSEVIAALIRDTDVLARLGGDEFGVILAHVTSEQAQNKAATLADALRTQPAIWNGSAIPVGFSYGVYELQAGETADSAMAHADRAMYAQKRSGR